MAPNGSLFGLNPRITITIVSLVLVGAMLLLRNRRPRPLNLERLWIRPVMAVVVIGLMLEQSPPPLTVMSVAVMVAAIAVGAALGWQRGRFTQIDVDPQTHAITARVSPIGILLVFGLIAARMILRMTLVGPGGSTTGFAAIVADALVVTAAMTMVVQQVEITLRARRLRNEARASSTA